MDCRETQTMLSAFHDGELPSADRARVEEHLRGCRVCRALLADLARADQAVGAPDPGPAYWDRFNERVMDRVEREADGPKAAVLRPKAGWMRQQLRYLVPAAAAAALVVVIVRYGGMYPGAPSPSVPSAVSEPAAPTPPENRTAKAEPESRATKKEESTGIARRVKEESNRAAEVPAAAPPAIDKERFAGITREEQDRMADRSLSAGNVDGSRDRAAAPARIDAPSPASVTTYRSSPAGSPPVTAADRITSGMQTERKKMEGAAAPAAEPQLAAKAESASGMGMAKDQSAEGPPAVSLGKSRSKAGPSPLASAPARSASPCELARTLADRERWREAETAQRTCLAQERSALVQEKGLVFLAELLDRQSRFAEADAVITEVDRQFPKSLALDLYRQQRPMVQKRRE